MTINVEEAIEILRVLGCDQDPIYYRGAELTPCDFEGSEHFDRLRLAKNYSIKYYRKTRGSNIVLVKGTFASLVADRMGF